MRSSDSRERADHREHNETDRNESARNDSEAKEMVTSVGND